MSMSQSNTIPVGARYFAAILLMIAGLQQFITGLTAVSHDTYYTIVASDDYILAFNSSTWGWIHLIVGILLALSGGLVVAGVVWARFLGAFIAAISAVLLFAWLPYNPVGATILIALDVFIIWALLASHGRPEQH